MNKIKVFITLCTAIILGSSSVCAASLDSVIKKSDLNKTATIAVSVKDTKTGRVVYEYNEHKYMNPASVLKIFTMKAAYDELGQDYTFQTSVYADNKNNLYIKLSADPSLSSDALKTLLSNVKENYKKTIQDIIVDSTVIDNKQWGTGWMWDDDTNSLLPKYSPYSVNENKIDLTIMDNVTYSDRVMQEEIFAPILPVIEYTNIDDIIEQFKTLEKPLALYIFAHDKALENKIINNISFGGGAVNDVIMHITNNNAPFGGVGVSGIGAYHGKYSFETFSHQKHIYKKYSFFDNKLRFFPKGNKEKLVRFWFYR